MVSVFDIKCHLMRQCGSAYLRVAAVVHAAYSLHDRRKLGKGEMRRIGGLLGRRAVQRQKAPDNNAEAQIRHGIELRLRFTWKLLPWS